VGYLREANYKNNPFSKALRRILKSKPFCFLGYPKVPTPTPCAYILDCLCRGLANAYSGNMNTAVQETKAMRFIEAYIQAGFNASAAAKVCFGIGSKGGKDDQRTAESMGSEYLRKPEVRELLEKRLREIADPAFVIENLVSLAKNAKRESDKIKSLELIGKFLAMFTDRHRFDEVDLAAAINSVEQNRKPIQWIDLNKSLESNDTNGKMIQEGKHGAQF